MSQLVELASEVHENNLLAARESQEAFLKLIETVTAFAPVVPVADVPEKYRDALSPALEFFGRPEEFTAFAVESARHWVQAVHDFTDAYYARVVVANS